MPRRIHHLVICVHDLAQAALDCEHGDRISVLGPGEMARRLPGVAGDMSPRFCAARLAITDLDAAKRLLKNNGVDFEVTDGVLLVPPTASHGPALEFIEQETI